MSNIKKSDVKNHLSPGFGTKIHLCQPGRTPAATGYSVAERGAMEENPLSFAEDFVGEHSLCKATLVRANPVNCSIGPKTPAASTSVQP